MLGLWKKSYYSVKGYLYTYPTQTTEFPAAVRLENHCQKVFWEYLKVAHNFWYKNNCSVTLNHGSVKGIYVVTWKASAAVNMP